MVEVNLEVRLRALRPDEKILDAEGLFTSGWNIVPQEQLAAVPAIHDAWRAEAQRKRIVDCSGRLDWDSYLHTARLEVQALGASRRFGASALLRADSKLPEIAHGFGSFAILQFGPAAQRSPTGHVQVHGACRR